MTTKTTNHLALSWRARLRLALLQRDLWSLALPLALALVASLIGLVLALQLYRAQQPAAAAAQPTPAAIILIATAQAETRPTPALPTEETRAAPIGHVLARAVVAYDAPAGKVIGAIDRGHAYQVVARYGSDWLQADVQGSGVVWLAVADVFDLPQGLADLAPTAAPEIVTVRVPVPIAAPQYTVDSAPPPIAPAYQLDSAASPDAATVQQWQADASADPNLAAHQQQQAASCDAGRITNAAYCQAVREWIAAQH